MCLYPPLHLHPMHTKLYNPVLKSLSSRWRQNTLSFMTGLQELLFLFQSQKPERLLPNLNYALCLFKLWNLNQLSAIYVSQVFSSLMMGHTWPDWTLLCFFLSGGCSCSATLQTCPQEAPDGGTRAGDPRAFSHYKCDFFPASSQASPPSPKVKTCTKHAKLQHEIWCSRVCSLHNSVLNSSVPENASWDTGLWNLHQSSQIQTKPVVTVTGIYR